MSQEEDPGPIPGSSPVESTVNIAPQLPSISDSSPSDLPTIASPFPSAIPGNGALDGYSRRSSISIRRSPSTQSLASTSSTTTTTTNLRKKTSMSSLQGAGGRTPPRSPMSAGRKPSSGFYKPTIMQNENPPPPPPLTSRTVAKGYFQRDLEGHDSHNGKSSSPEVAVIFHDACYGHRFSRPRTSKASLNTIVERPERIRATVLGVSTAYVLLGGRHAAGIHAPHPEAQPGAVPFLIRKSSRRVSLSTPAVTSVHGSGWMGELQEMCEGAEAKLAMNGKELTRPGVNDVTKSRLHDGDLYLCAESLEAFEGALGGVLDAVDTVFSSTGPRRCFACVRPPGHHCSSDYPSGFCWLNNIHVGISYAASAHGLTHAAIFDFDLHHGDGSQAIAWDRNARVSTLPKNTHISKKTKIGYFSLHDINSYPCEWGDEEKVRDASLCIENAHGQTVWNVHLQPWGSDAEFWELYNNRYSILLKKMRRFLRTQNDKLHSLGHGQKSKGAIFISAGFDASEWEGHGMQRHEVNVPTDFYARVTHDIVGISIEEGLGVGGRVISVLEGGYSDRALTSGALSHVCGLTSSFGSGKPSSTVNSLTADTIGVLPSVEPTANSAALPLPYTSDWWSPVRLEELERLVSPAPAAPLPRKPRGGAAPTYQTPTQSFMTKVVSPPTYQRSISSSMYRQSSGPLVAPRPATPPPPEVEWTVASQELAKLLIPQDRTTRSCAPEDLNAKATEARRNRQSFIGTTTGVVPELPIEEMQKMQLRDRKAKPEDSSVEDLRPASRASAARRRTVGGIELGDKDSASRSRRRVSIASSVMSNTDDGPGNNSALQPDQLILPKQRAPSKPRVAKKAPSKPPIPRLPSVLKKEAVPQGLENVPSASLPAAPQADEMASLASDVKKLSIKLNVPSREEYEARDARKQAAASEPKKPTVIKAPRKQAVKKPAKEPIKAMKARTEPLASRQSGGYPRALPMTENVAPAASTPETPILHNVLPQPIEPSIPAPGDYKSASGFTAPAAESLVVTAPSFQPPNDTAISATATAPMPDLPDFQMTGVDSLVVPGSLPITSEMPPLTTFLAPPSTFASPEQAKNNLPVFLANGPIPFAPSRAGNEQIPNERPTNVSADEDLEKELTDAAGAILPDRPL